MDLDLPNKHNTNSTVLGFTVSAVKAVKASHWGRPMGGGNDVEF